MLIHEDDDVVAVSKPPGEPVIAERGGAPGACLRRRLESERKERLWVVHRIDKDASGLVVFARSAAAHRALSLSFQHRKVEKRYVALVAGRLAEEKGTIDVALHAARRGKTRPARPGEPGSQTATTVYKVQDLFTRDDAAISLLEVRPRTGRRHQIRVHLRSVEAPLLFDPLYGRRLLPPGLDDAPGQRLALHAQGLKLPSPRAGEKPLALEAPLPSDLEALRDWIRAEWVRGEGTPS